MWAVSDSIYRFEAVKGYKLELDACISPDMDSICDNDFSGSDADMLYKQVIDKLFIVVAVFVIIVLKLLKVINWRWFLASLLLSVLIAIIAVVFAVCFMNK